ncbi:uncharacterized protein BXZ73DRAFT_92980 [Epithele typhae]|uniref:uncharacterized protein n=1 Tax=Epithele typhae TaxID=378194 RepID=UPI002008CC60|nr:uncharacterized protein BXZ73DRAFT_92980 [Epithele typhae]KAH9913334.1 hypothetical protein BXZ73DRAFT_92980 [Epithele typhae]
MDEAEDAQEGKHPLENAYQAGASPIRRLVPSPTGAAGTIERGHIYFFYRPKVEREEAHSLDDVQRFYILLCRGPPVRVRFRRRHGQRWGAGAGDGLVEEGADAVPAAEPQDEPKKPFRLIHVGKKGLPDPERAGGGGGRRRQMFWASVDSVGDDLTALQAGLEGSTYETKTRGASPRRLAAFRRTGPPARLAAAYAIVNQDARIPSQRETHLGYHLSHPLRTSWGRQRAQYPPEIMKGVFGKGGRRGNETYGLRFAACERREMLDYEGTELLLIASRSGEEGLEESLGGGRGKALEEAEDRESQESIDEVMKELAMDVEKIPADPLEGLWA